MCAARPSSSRGRPRRRILAGTGSKLFGHDTRVQKLRVFRSVVRVPARENAERAYVQQGDIDAYDLETDITEIEVDGSGSCKVSVADELTAKISGSGYIYFKGHPIVSKKIEGLDSVKDVN